MELLKFLAAIFVIYLLFFRKKKRKSPKSYASDPVKAPPKEWLADIKKKRRLCETMIVKTITLQLLH
jgi:hypothetical protein